VRGGEGVGGTYWERDDDHMCEGAAEEEEFEDLEEC